MTDIAELIERARSPFALTERDANEIADALEAQAKEIEKLNSIIEGAFQSNLQHCRLQDAQSARIAEQDYLLEMKWRAEDRAIKAWQAKTGEHLTWPDQAKLVEWLLDELHAARAAMNGEKG